jgi:hypothetical protein
MLILIKSFKRPYLLEFCIQSIKKNIKGEYFIVVIDDGTPDIYLKKIKLSFPDILIEKSSYYFKKSTMCSPLLNSNQKLILPHNDWNSLIIKYSHDYFLILEDDQFVTEKIDLNKLNIFCTSNNLMFFNFNVLNKKLNYERKDCNNDFVIYDGKNIIYKSIIFLFFTSENIVNRIIRKIFSTLFKNKFVFDFKNYALPVYDIFIIAGGIYKKKYYLKCNYNTKDELDEFAQLRNAIKYNFFKFWKLKYAISINQKIKTSFCSTVISGSRNTDFNPILFNQLMNSIWYKGDFSYFDIKIWEVKSSEVKRLLTISNTSLSAEIWEKYTELFKSNYRKLGYKL